MSLLDRARNGKQAEMAISAFRQHIAASLRVRVLLLLLVGFVAVAVPTALVFTTIVNSTVVKLGTLFAEKQILYDRYRGLEALMREVGLAETLAGTSAIRDWSRDETDPLKRSRGIAELEHYRQTFGDKSYFYVVGASGNYYFNDRANSYAGEQLRYTVSRDNPADAWYFSTAALEKGCYLNVNNDAVLKVTKVWINCVVREGNTVLGVLGTGVDLTAFIREVVDIPQVGVTSIFVDRSGAVQAHRDPRLVDFHSLTKAVGAKKTVFSMFEKPEDQTALQALMDEVTSEKPLVRSQFMDIEGKQMLVGVGYLDRLGWYNVTLMDVDKIIDRGLFVPIGALLAALMLAVALVMALVFKRSVLDRLGRLEKNVHAVERGDFAGAAVATETDRPDEIGRLSSAFSVMAAAVGVQTADLEKRVRQRTEELERLAFLDTLTGIPNRRGFLALYGAAQKTDSAPRMGVLLVDIDQFKPINDTYGHGIGDEVVIAIARRIGDGLGENDHCARWGGDEFIVLLGDMAPHLLRATAYRVIASVSETPIVLRDGRELAVTVSIGACLVEPGETLEKATDRADAAMYLAKAEGRNTVAVFREGLDRTGTLTPLAG